MIYKLLDADFVEAVRGHFRVVIDRVLAAVGGGVGEDGVVSAVVGGVRVLVV